MDPQRRPAWSPFFNVECAVAAHSRPTLSLMKEALKARIRTAVNADSPAVIDCDAHASSREVRRNLLRAATSEGRCLVAEVDATVCGFVVLSHDFFEQSFIALVVVAQEFRRLGIGLQLLGAAESSCRTAKLFASTNSSNAVAQALLERAGFALSGVVENLDENDPELIYFKWTCEQHDR